MKNEAVIIDMGKRITELRKSKKISQEELAERSGVTAQTISSAERGLKALRPANLLNICKALDTSSDYLLTGKIAPAEVAIILEKLNRLSPEQFRLIEEVIDKCLELCSSNSDSRGED
ncbi:MAG: helix-turn-helix transcriptional regulator [Clostridia bacterium]|nr:helix-turn-helix transcriptional regulator [Clostridia bacterium]